MAIVERQTPEETRGRILYVAWDLFRQLGARTTVADIAAKLGHVERQCLPLLPLEAGAERGGLRNLLGEMLKAAAPRAQRAWHGRSAHRAA